MTDTQPTSIDAVVEELVHKSRSLFDDAIRIPSETHYTNRVAECQKILRSALTTLVEQAKGEGREEVISLVSRAKSAIPVEDEPISRFGHIVLQEIINEARTISSDKK